MHIPTDERGSHTPRCLVLGAIFAATMLVVACGGGGNDAEGDGSGLDFGDQPPTHEQIVERAEAESGTLRVAGSFEDEEISDLTSTFKEKYPFAELEVTDVPSDEGPTILLELESGRHDGDLIKIEENKWNDYVPFMDTVDLLKLHEAKSLNLGLPEMIGGPDNNLFAYATYLGVTAWNPDVVARYGIDMNAVNTYEDLIGVCAKLPAGQMVTDASPEQIAQLAIVKGDAWLKTYAEDFLKACQPVFTRGNTPRLTGISSGEWAISQAGNHHSVLQQIADGARLDFKALTPITGKMSGLTGLRKGSEMPYTALLFLEHMASKEGQGILDKYGPSASFVPADGASFPQNEGFQNSKLVLGKELALTSWATLDEYVAWIHTVQEAWGFPTGVK